MNTKKNIKNYGIIPEVESLQGEIFKLEKELKALQASGVELNFSQKVVTDIDTLLNHIENLPESLWESYSLIVNVIDTLSDSRKKLKQSVSGLLKKAGSQLQKVSTTTEEATNKIMDTAEKLDEDQDEIIGLLDKLNIEEDKNVEIVQLLKKKAQINQDAAFKIMDYLQFQDITAQQITGAYSILSDVEKSLIYVSQKLNRFNQDIDEDIKPSMRVDAHTFNADATFEDKKIIQHAIDDLFSGDENVEIPETKEKNVDKVDFIKQNETQNSQTEQNTENQASQDDIDKLFE